MLKTFTAKSPGRYVVIQRNFTATPGEDHKLVNSVTGYKMVVDLERGIYSSFIQEGSKEWTLHSLDKRMSDKAGFWREVGNGELVEEV